MTSSAAFADDAALLRIFVGDEDEHDGHAVYRLITEKAREAGLAGATVLPGPLSYGQRGILRSEFAIDAGVRVPVVVEIVDTAEKIEAFLPTVDGMIGSGLITIEKVRARYYPGRDSR